MSDAAHDTEYRAIRDLIKRQFRSLSWTRARPPAWKDFAADFMPGARLVPSARPAKPATVPEFVDRMASVARSSLPVFDETLAGVDIKLYGNVAIAFAACEQREETGPPNHTVEALLLVKDAGAWRIVAQAWDNEREGDPVLQAVGGA